MTFDLQLFGGGGTTTTTSRNIPNQSALEAQLLGGSTDSSNGKGSDNSTTGITGLSGYANTGLTNASNLQSQANTAIGNTYNPDWGTYAANYDNMANEAYTNYGNTTANNLSGYKSDMSGLTNNYNTTTANALNNYQDSTSKYLNDYKTSAGNALNTYNNNQAGVTSGYQSLANGELPTAYATNRQKALNADLTGTVGTAISGLGNRGILNSSVTNSSLNNISQNASNTLANNYTSDLNTESGLLGNESSNNNSVYNNNYNNANNLYGNQSSNANSLYGNQISNAQGVFNNSYNGLNSTYGAETNQANDLYKNALGNANSELAANQTAQTNSYYQPTQDQTYANNDASSASNLFNTLYSGRMGTSGATQSTSGGNNGTTSAVAQLGSAAILCFILGTDISTPQGNKKLRDIKVGDKVCSLDGIQTVTYVQKPVMSNDEYMTVILGNKKVTTTAMQPFITDYGDVLAKELDHIPAEKELVSDLTVTGSNTYYANGLLVRGRE